MLELAGRGELGLYLWRLPRLDWPMKKSVRRETT